MPGQTIKVNENRTITPRLAPLRRTRSSVRHCRSFPTFASSSGEISPGLRMVVNPQRRETEQRQQAIHLA